MTRRSWRRQARFTHSGTSTHSSHFAAALIGDPKLAPGAARAAYGHLAAFCRAAPESQRVAVWQAVGEALHGMLGGAAASAPPVWLSTEGSGVPWLHVRLDSRPKYYHHRKYAR